MNLYMCMANSRYQWPYGVRHRLAAAHLLRLSFESCWGHGCFSVANVVCCQVGVFVMLITHPEESCWVLVCRLSYRNLKNEEAMTCIGPQSHEEKKYGENNILIVAFLWQTMWNVSQAKKCQDGTSQISCTHLWLYSECCVESGLNPCGIVCLLGIGLVYHSSWLLWSSGIWLWVSLRSVLNCHDVYYSYSILSLSRFKSAGLYVAGRVFNPDNI